MQEFCLFTSLCRLIALRLSCYCWRYLLFFSTAVWSLCSVLLLFFFKIFISGLFLYLFLLPFFSSSSNSLSFHHPFLVPFTLSRLRERGLVVFFSPFIFSFSAVVSDPLNALHYFHLTEKGIDLFRAISKKKNGKKCVYGWFHVIETTYSSRTEQKERKAHTNREIIRWWKKESNKQQQKKNNTIRPRNNWRACGRVRVR